jgi:hypothetical protein
MRFVGACNGKNYVYTRCKITRLDPLTLQSHTFLSQGNDFIKKYY